MPNVKDFGAFGDGITDDTEAIEMAATYGKILGENITFPPGTYLFNKAASLTFASTGTTILPFSKEPTPLWEQL